MPVQTRTLGTMADRVERGIVLLDEHDPSWRERVDPTRLHMAGCTHCVLGQAFADEVGAEYGDGFEAGVEILDLDGVVPTDVGLVDQPSLFGFDCVPFERYGDLTTAWLRRLDRVDA